MSHASSNYIFLRDMAKLAGKMPKVRIHRKAHENGEDKGFNACHGRRMIINTHPN